MNLISVSLRLRVFFYSTVGVINEYPSCCQAVDLEFDAEVGVVAHAFDRVLVPVMIFVCNCDDFGSINNDHGIHEQARISHQMDEPSLDL